MKQIFILLFSLLSWFTYADFRFEMENNDGSYSSSNGDFCGDRPCRWEHDNKGQDVRELGAIDIARGQYLDAELHRPYVFVPPPDLVSFQKKVDYLHSQAKRRKEISTQIKNMDQYQKRKEILSYATDSLRISKDHYLNDDEESGHIASQIADVFLDLSTSLTPGVSWARDLYEAVSGKDAISGDDLDTFSRSIAVLGTVTAGFGSKIPKAMGVLKKLMKGETVNDVIHFSEKLLGSSRTAGEIRNSPGLSIVSAELFDSKTILRGSHKNAGLIPKEIGEKLVRRNFKDFKDFKEQFWLTVSESKYVTEFGPTNLSHMRKGNAPFTLNTQALGKRNRYELHHIQPISQGGGVYDLDNLMIVTPRFHLEVLEKGYHRGN